MKTPVLVTGASGHLGRRVLELLIEQGVSPIIATTRKPETLADFAKKGVDVRRADFDDEASLKTAFAGAGRALLISTDAMDRPGRRLEQHTRAVAALQGAGVKHVVYTSMIQPKGSVMGVAPDHAGTEAAIEASSLSYTFLRNSLYLDLLPTALTPALATGQWITARGAAKAAFVTREDCARAAAAALASDRTEREFIDITGAESLDSDAIARIVSDVADKPLAHLSVPVDALIDGLVKHARLPQPVAQLVASFDSAIAKGELSVASDGVKRLTGRAPISVREFVSNSSLAKGRAN